MGMFSGITGTLDHLAGSTDEAIGRQFDDEPGGGFADPDTWTSAGDDLAGNVDEAIGRQFDDEKGGGFIDEAFGAGDEGMATFSESLANWPILVDMFGRTATGRDPSEADMDFGLDFDIFENKLVLFVGIIVAAYALGQLFDVDLGGSST